MAVLSLHAKGLNCVTLRVLERVRCAVVSNNQKTNIQTIKPTNHPKNKLINKSTNQSTDQLTNKQANKQLKSYPAYYYIVILFFVIKYEFPFNSR